MIQLIVLWGGLGVAAVAAGLVAGSGSGNKSRHFGKTFKLGFSDREYFKFYDLEPEKTY